MDYAGRYICTVVRRFFFLTPGGLKSNRPHVRGCVRVHVVATDDGRGGVSFFLLGVAGGDAGGVEGLVWRTSPKLNRYADHVLSKAGASFG